jgi:predicted ester cyclase
VKNPYLVLLVFFLVLVGMTPGCKKQVAVGITEEQAKAVMDGALEIWNEGNLAVVDKFFSPDFVMHDPMYPEPIVGVNAFKDTLSEESKTFSEGNLRVDDYLIKGDKIVIIWTWSGTHSGPMALPSGEIPPTGNKLSHHGVSVCRMAKGKITEFWFYYNPLDMFLPMGFTLNPPQPNVEIKK